MAFRSEVLIKVDKKGRALLPAAFRDELPTDDRSAFVLYHSPNLTRVVHGTSRKGFDAMPARLRLAALGPQHLTVAGHTLRGHTFHYSTSDSSAPVVARTARPHEAVAPDAGEALYQLGSIHASYFHAWFPSSPEAVAHLLGGGGHA